MDKLSEWQKYLREQTGKSSDDIRSEERADYTPRRDTAQIDKARYSIQRKLPIEPDKSAVEAESPSANSLPEDDLFTVPMAPPPNSSPITRGSIPSKVKVVDRKQPLKPAAVVKKREIRVSRARAKSEETAEELLDRLVNPTITLEEAAKIMGVCKATVRRYTSRGLLPHYRTPGNQRRFKLHDIIQFMNSGKHDTEDE